MTQGRLPESNSPAGTRPASPSPEKTPAYQYSSPYQVGGPHSKLRTQLLWVNRLLASDETNSVSAISVRELARALSAFQKDLRVQVLGVGGLEASSRSPSRTPTGQGSQGSRTIKARTRNFKS